MTLAPSTILLGPPCSTFISCYSFICTHTGVKLKRLSFDSLNKPLATSALCALYTTPGLPNLGQLTTVSCHSPTVDTDPTPLLLEGKCSHLPTMDVITIYYKPVPIRKEVPPSISSYGTFSHSFSPSISPAPITRIWKIKNCSSKKLQ